MTGAPSPTGPGAAHQARALRRQALRLRRRLDILTGWTLGALVAGSLVLGAALWSGALWASSPLARASTVARAYLTADGMQTWGDSTSAAAPERLILLYPGARGDLALDDPQDSNYRFVWQAALALLLGVGPNSAAPVGFKQASAALAAFSAPPSATGGPSCPRAGLEVDVGSVLPWAAWLEAAWGASATGLPAWPVDRVLLLPAGVSAPGAAPPSAVPTLFVLDGASAAQVELSPKAYAGLQADLCQVQGIQDAASYAVAPLAPEGVTAGVPVGVEHTVSDPGALLVPSPDALAAWQPLLAQPEELDADQLALSIFPDPLAVRSAGGASTIFQSAQNWTLTVGAGRASLVVPTVPGLAPDAYAGLVTVLRYVDLRGGWPPGAWLSGLEQNSTAANCVIVSCAATSSTYAFSTREQNLPVLPLGDAPPAISVTIGGGGQVSFYLRAVSLAGPPGGGGPAVLSAADAVQSVYAAPPAGLQRQSFQVVAVTPAWTPSGAYLEPAWAVEADQPAGGQPVLVLVDAVHGSVLGASAGR